MKWSFIMAYKTLLFSRNILQFRFYGRFISNVLKFHCWGEILRLSFFFVTEYFEQRVFCKSRYLRNIGIDQCAVSIPRSNWNLIHEAQRILYLKLVLFFMLVILYCFPFNSILQWGREVQDSRSEVGDRTLNQSLVGFVEVQQIVPKRILW